MNNLVLVCHIIETFEAFLKTSLIILPFWRFRNKTHYEEARQKYQSGSKYESPLPVYADISIIYCEQYICASVTYHPKCAVCYMLFSWKHLDHVGIAYRESTSTLKSINKQNAIQNIDILKIRR